MNDTQSAPSSERDERGPEEDPGFVPGLDDLTAAAAERVRRFVADGTLKGGASPSDVADLYTSPEIVEDVRATAYLDRRYVHGTLPPDWRRLEDELASAYYNSPPGTTSDELLAQVADQNQAGRTRRSIFDDPDDLDDDGDDRGAALADRDPTLSDLSDSSRAAIERHVIAEVFNYGMAPIHAMLLRETLREAEDERAIQYFDLPHERGDRPADWNDLRDRALAVRGMLERLGRDPSETFARMQSSHPHLGPRALMRVIEEQAADRSR